MQLLRDRVATFEEAKAQFQKSWMLLDLDSKDRVPPSVRIISRSLFLSVEALGAIALARCPGGLPRRPAGPGGLRLIRVTVTGDGA